MAAVRSTAPDDLSAMLDLYRQLNPDDPELDADRARCRWREMLDDDSLHVLVLDVDGRPVATCVLSVTPNLTRNARPFAVIENVVTDEDYRGRGFGEQVVRAAVVRAEERGCYKVMLLTGTDAEWKLAFYEKCGFEREDKTGFVRYMSR